MEWLPLLFGGLAMLLGISFLRSSMPRWRRPRETFDKEQELRRQQHDAYAYRMGQSFQHDPMLDRPFKAQSWGPEQLRDMRKEAFAGIAAGGFLLALGVVIIVAGAWLGGW